MAKYRFVSWERVQPELQVARVPMTPMEALMSSGPFTEVPRSRLEFDRLANLVETAVATLDELDQEILIAKVFERLTFREIADRHGISKSNAHWRYGRSLANVRNWLTKWAYEKGVTQAIG